MYICIQTSENISNNIRVEPCTEINQILKSQSVFELALQKKVK